MDGLKSCGLEGWTVVASFRRVFLSLASSNRHTPLILICSHIFYSSIALTTPSHPVAGLPCSSLCPSRHVLFFRLSSLVPRLSLSTTFVLGRTIRSRRGWRGSENEQRRPVSLINGFVLSSDETRDFESNDSFTSPSGSRLESFGPRASPLLILVKSCATSPPTRMKTFV